MLNIPQETYNLKKKKELLGTLRTALDKEEIRSAIQISMNYPMGKIIERYAREQGIDLEEAQKHEVELKRFLAICAVFDNSISMTGPIDELWHTFVIYTREYADFCQKVAGHFIHHVPNDESHHSNNNLNEPDYFTLGYEHLFGRKPPSEIWPDVSAVPCSGNGCSSKCGSGCRDGDCCGIKNSEASSIH